MAVRTHKEENGLADDYHHPWSLDEVPRRPWEYEPVPPEPGAALSHFIIQKKNRRVDGETVRSLIEKGRVYEAEGDNRYRFLWTHPTTMETFSLIVELRPEAFDRDGARHYAVTVYKIQR